MHPTYGGARQTLVPGMALTSCVRGRAMPMAAGLEVSSLVSGIQTVGNQSRERRAGFGGGDGGNDEWRCAWTWNSAIKPRGGSFPMSFCIWQITYLSYSLQAEQVSLEITALDQAPVA